MLATWGCATFPKPTLDLQFAGATSLDSRITFTRASTATYFNSAGVLTTANNDVARFDYDPSTLAARGLLIEEARTNSIRNNTMQGAVAGTPGTLPTNWSTFTSLTGLTREVVGTGTESGITYIDIKLSGTPSAAGAFDIYSETATGVAATTGQTWSQSFYIRVAAGTTTGVTSITPVLLENTSGGVFVTSQGGTSFTPATTALNINRRTQTATLAGGATVACVRPLILLNLSGVAIDITLRIGLPQLELGAFATSVIPTTTTALTRNADVASMTGTNFSSWYNQAEGTLVGQFFIPPNLAGFPTTIGALSDGTTTNQISPYAFTSGLYTNIRTLSVVQGDPGVLVTPTVGALAKFAVGIGTNNSVSVWNGTAGTVDTTVTLPTVNQFIIGANGAGSSRINSHIQRISYYPSRLPNTTLQALTA